MTVLEEKPSNTLHAEGQEFCECCNKYQSRKSIIVLYKLLWSSGNIILAFMKITIAKIALFHPFANFYASNISPHMVHINADTIELVVYL